MNNYIEELSNIAKLPFNEISKDLKVIMISNKLLYICNYIKILDYSKERLVVKISKTTLEVCGEELCISQINKGEIVVKGKVFTCQFGEVNEKNNK